ncbi:hypothetical protein [Nostoc sp. CCY 9925]|uniref:hypothetical protein n=1 Tax=Nostoc sp. CCY 9925 TaxID=3103865 RepID=UPI0039C6F1B6
MTPGEISPAKKEGVQAIANKSYDKVIAIFSASLKVRPNDPEARIWYNSIFSIRRSHCSSPTCKNRSWLSFSYWI